MPLRIIAVIVSFLLAGPVLANDVVTQIPVDEDFVENRISWTSGHDSYVFRTRLIGQDGMILFCGVGVYLSGQYRSATNKGLRDAELKVNGQTVLRDVRYFAVANSTRALDTATANCASAGPIPQNIDSIDFKLGRLQARN